MWKHDTYGSEMGCECYFDLKDVISFFSSALVCIASMYYSEVMGMCTL